MDHDAHGHRSAGETLDLEGRYLLPGYLEPHCHPDFMYSPLALAAEVLTHGTTGLFCDTLFLLAVVGPSNVHRVLDLLQAAPIRMWWAVPSSPRTRVAEGDPLPVGRISRELLGRDDVALLAEVTRWLDAIEGDPELLAAIQLARARGLRVDGHSAGARSAKAAAYVVSGVTADHEPIDPDELLEKLHLGLWCMLRHSSLRPDLPRLAELLVRQPWLMERLMLTTDGPSPDFLVEVGHIDALVKLLIDMEFDPLEVYRMASLNVALYYRVEDRLGLVAPGRAADLMVVEDLRQPRPTMVMVGGRWVARDGNYVGGGPSTEELAAMAVLHFKGPLPSTRDVMKVIQRSLPGTTPVLRFESTVITRLEKTATAEAFERSLAHDGDTAMGWLLSRDGKRVTASFVKGLGEHVTGLVSTLNTACEYLILGKDLQAMQLALDRLVGMGGGMVAVAQDGSVHVVPLPIGGRMSGRPVEEVAAQYEQFREALRRLGYPFHDPGYTLHFLTGDLLPEVRLTPAGVWDVRRREVLVPSLILRE